MSLTDEFYLYNYIDILSKKDNLLKIGKFLGVEAKSFNEILDKTCNMAYR